MWNKSSTASVCKTWVHLLESTLKSCFLSFLWLDGAFIRELWKGCSTSLLFLASIQETNNLISSSIDNQPVTLQIRKGPQLISSYNIKILRMLAVCTLCWNKKVEILLLVLVNVERCSVISEVTGTSPISFLEQRNKREESMFIQHTFINNYVPGTGPGLRLEE